MLHAFLRLLVLFGLMVLYRVLGLPWYWYLIGGSIYLTIAVVLPLALQSLRGSYDDSDDD
jgi:hypothetical protein